MTSITVVHDQRGRIITVLHHGYSISRVELPRAVRSLEGQDLVRALSELPSTHYVWLESSGPRLDRFVQSNHANSKSITNASFVDPEG